ncbi:UDP-N-acetylmuramoyl-L-alanine--D-glutamate ligase [Methylocella sp.]|jgi:UDP-N-acetylmuramoylalanine--D-glutamate ligase|uniref:UDP-N-acetylmuramoyl-L-alanine--D-glutamate ligase n=1 Tax=Methylocella sp. TaxID=1978226 RepID=UPI003C225E86
MTPVTVFAGQSVAVFGLGGSGFVTAQALVAGGAHVNVWDDNEHAREKARAAGLRIENLAGADWRSFSALVLSPGVPLTHPAPHWTVLKAKEAGIEVIGDIELFCRERRRIAPGAPFVAITGTNGKSTTTALVAHLFRTFGFPVEVGGNIGTPILALAPPDESRVHIIECSSYQIDLAPSLDPSVGILLNVTPDHLDRHGTMENYAAIKARLVHAADLAVVGVDDAFTRAIAAELRGAGRNLTEISAAGAAVDDGIVFEDGRLYRRAGASSALIADLAGIASLRGAHNGQNAAAAVAALGPLGLDSARVAKGLASFPGLAHRLEEVGRRGKVLFVNDSKATNADAAEKALLSFKNIFWILGGRAKQGGIEPLRPLFDRIVKAYLIGEASEAFAKTIGGAFPVAFCETLESAVPKAAIDAGASAIPDPVVLLSPACASFDHFPDFEKRGDRFRDLAKALIEAP